VAVPALQLDVRTVRSAPDWSHMNGMIKPDAARIAVGIDAVPAQGLEFWMAIRQTVNVRRIVRRPGLAREVSMAGNAGLVAGSGNVDATAVFSVAFGASEMLSADGNGAVVSRPVVVCRAVVAVEAGGVGGLGGKGAGLPEVAGGAFFFENSVGARHAATGINAMVTRETAPGNPTKSEERQD